MTPRQSSLRFALAAIALASFVACAATPSKNGPGDDGDFPVPDGDGTTPLPPPREPDVTDNDASAFNIGNRGKDASTTNTDAGTREHDASRPAPDAAAPPDASAPPDANPPPPDASPPPDSGTVTPPTACVGPLAAKDLAVVELMISSQSGSGDHGEWIEVQSTRDCILNLKGLHIESPRGTSFDTADVTSDLFLQPNGIVVVATSPDAAQNHALPTPIIVFTGAPADVLKNDGDTVTLSAGGVTIDTITYPAFTIYPGRSISFPADCTWADRPTWARWSYSFNVWSGAFQGTPNADNDDVACY